jgi:hypothetical protein
VARGPGLGKCSQLKPPHVYAAGSYERCCKPK